MKKYTLNSKIKYNFTNTFNLPFLTGIYLGVNSIKNAALIIDGPNCVYSKLGYITNNDINSNFKPFSSNKLFFTMNWPLSPSKNIENNISKTIEEVNSKNFEVIFLTNLPFTKLQHIDYYHIIKKIKHNTPIIIVDMPSLSLDWIDGYSMFISSILKYINENKEINKSKKIKNSISLIGYLYHRNEYDTKADIKELQFLLNMIDFDVVNIFPNGESFNDLVKKIANSQYTIVFPYLENDNEIKNICPNFIRTKYPIGISNTVNWIENISKKLNRKISKNLYKLALEYIQRIQTLLSVIRFKKSIYLGDPFLFSSLSLAFNEIDIEITDAILLTRERKNILNEKIDGNIYINFDKNKVKTIINKQADIYIGNSFMAELLENCNKYIEFGFPSFFHHNIIEIPSIGLNGTLNLYNRIFNIIKRKEAKYER